MIVQYPHRFRIVTLMDPFKGTLLKLLRPQQQSGILNLGSQGSALQEPLWLPVRSRERFRACRDYRVQGLWAYRVQGLQGFLQGLGLLGFRGLGFRGLGKWSRPRTQLRCVLCSVFVAITLHLLSHALKAPISNFKWWFRFRIVNSSIMGPKARF